MSRFKEFWEKLLTQVRIEKLPLNNAVTDEYEHLRFESDVPSIFYAFVVEYHFPEVIVEFDRSIEDNDYFFDSLIKQRSDIEDEFDDELVWNKKNEQRKTYRISYKNLKLNYKREEQWDEIIAFMLAGIKKLHKVINIRIEILYDAMLKELKRKSYTGPIRMENVSFKNFLAFKNNEFQICNGINLFIGDNDTGKTCIIKMMYAMAKSWEIYSRKEYYEKVAFKKVLGEKMFDIFQPRENRKLGDLVTKGVKDKMEVDILFRKTIDFKQNLYLKFGESTYKTINDCPDELDTVGLNFNAVFIPAKEVLTAFKTIKYIRERLFLPGFDDTYLDLIRNLEAPLGIAKKPDVFINIHKQLEDLYSGSLELSSGEEPFVFNRGTKKFAISVTSEGIKKISIITSLLHKNQLQDGSLLFIDEPESNLHPSAIRKLVDAIAQIAKAGVQVFLASHSYVVLMQLAISARKYDVPTHCFTLSKTTNEYIKADFTDLRVEMPKCTIIDEVENLIEEAKSVLKS